jgi:hypothetical protein
MKVEQGKKYCTIVPLPRPLSDADPSRARWLPYEFRKLPNSQDQLLFSAERSPIDPGPFNIFRIILSNPTQIQAATEDEWQKGAPMALVPKRGEIIENVFEGPPPPSDHVTTTDSRAFRPHGSQVRKIWRFVGVRTGVILSQQRLRSPTKLEWLDGE